MLDTLQKMFYSIRTTDAYIGLFALGEMAVFVFAYILAKSRGVALGKSSMKINGNPLIILYNIFTAGISIFPLLGMFGTVSGLLGLDLVAGDMTNIRNNFFMALTSTAWGILFSIGFKLLYAVSENFFNERIEEITERIRKHNELIENR